MKRILFALLVISLLVITQNAEAHTYKPKHTKSNTNLKHKRIHHARKGSVLVYNP